MAVPAPNYTPVRARRGRVIHAVSEGGGENRESMCGVPAPRGGWVISLARVTCDRCRGCTRRA